MPDANQKKRASLPVRRRPGKDNQPADLPTGEVLSGFHELLRRAGMAAESALRGSSVAYALAELLVKKGLLSIDELDAARHSVEQRLLSSLVENGVTVQLTDDAPDKYEMGDSEVSIDCASRVELCHAACCRLRFALTEQDVEEGIVQWSLREPYLNRHDEAGYCVHITSELSCSIHASRPSICRGYDCRKDSRIWVDFDARVPNPQLLQATGLSEQGAVSGEPPRESR